MLCNLARSLAGLLAGALPQYCSAIGQDIGWALLLDEIAGWALQLGSNVSGAPRLPTVSV